MQINLCLRIIEMNYICSYGHSMYGYELLQIASTKTSSP